MELSSIPGLEWWIDPGITGQPIWAVIRINDWGEVSVLDIDGRLHLFETLHNARLWLREDEYESFCDLGPEKRKEYRIPLDCLPPKRGYNADLLEWMRNQFEYSATVERFLPSDLD